MIKAERNLDREALIQKALEQVEYLRITYDTDSAEE